MKKKLIGILLIITIIICTAAGLSACGKSETPSEETNYTDGNGEENNNTDGNDDEEEQEEQIEAPELDDMQDGVVYISDFSIKYTSAADSPNGEINESKLSSKISGSVEEYFMVIDFTMQMNEVNTARQTLTLTVKIYDDEVIYGTIDSAPTSNYTEVTADNITTISLTFTLPETAGEAKTVRTVIDLTPKTEGVVDISYGMECESKKISGCPETDVTFTIASSTMSTAKTSLEYTLNNNGKSYKVIGIGTKTGGETYIRETYGGLPVTAIADGAFKTCSALTKLYIPDCVTYIGKSAFYGCTSLKGINIPDTITEIYVYTFYNCKLLKSIIIPDGITSIGNSAFYGCTKLASVNLGSGVTSIGCEAFYGCASLKSITIPDVVTSIDSYAFGGCTSLAGITVSSGNTAYKSVDGNLYNYDGTQFIQYAAGQSTTSFVLPDGVTYVCEGAFSGCSLTSITIPDSVTSIGSAAFGGCSALTSITLPFVGDSVKTSTDTYQYPFGYIFGTSSYTGGTTTKQYYYGSSTSEATNVTYYIPTALTSVTIIGGEILYGAFYNCSNITSVTISGGITSFGDYAFENCTALTSIDIPNSVTSFGDYVFENCTALTSIDIPDSITSIGGSAFSGCTSLTSITIPNSETVIRDRMFYGCTALTSVTMPDGITSIGVYTFCGCTSLTSIAIPDNVTSIGNSTFYNCTSLTSITIPDSVTSIGSAAFGGCSALTSVTLPFVGGSLKTSTGTYQYPFGYIFGSSYYTGGTATKQYYCGSSTSSTTNSTYYIPATLTTVTITGGNILYGAFYNCTSLTSITIPDGVTSIGDNAFRGCTSLTRITIPDNVTSIGNYAFSSCTSLTSITIPNRVTSIGNYAFSSCTSLTSITIPNRATSIGNYAFSSCTSLINITIPDSVTSIGNKALYNTAYYNDTNNWENNVLYIGNYLIAAKAKISDEYSIKDGTIVIAAYAFNECILLASINIPDSVTSIGSSAFYGCTVLTSVTIGSGVTSIGGSAFYNCTSLTSVYITDLEAWCKISFGDGGNSSPMYYATNLYLNGEIITGDIVLSDNVTAIPYGTFKNSTITGITIPDSVTSIGSAAFGGCSALTSITLPFVGGSASATNVSSSTLFGYIFGTSSYAGGTSTKQYFATGSYVTYYIPTTLRTVTITGGDILFCAFYDCTSLTSITIPDGVTSIGDNAFSGCSSLTSMVIPDSVTSIGKYAFYNCTSLTSINIPDSVTSIGSSAFGGCTSLTSTTVGNGNRYYKSIDGNLYSYDGTELIQYAAGKKDTSFVIPDGITSIGDSAFGGCTSLTSVTIGDSVTSIGSSAFESCSSLESVTIGSGVTSIGDSTFYNTAYYNDTNNWENNVLYIGNYLIEAKTTISGEYSIKDGTTVIASYAFGSCTALTNITIHDSVTSIGDYAFYNCSSLTSVYYNGTASQWASISFGNSYANPLYYAGNLYLNGTLVTDITLEGITTINAYAFCKCTSLTSITIPDSVTSIGSSAFSGCTSLTSITIPNSVTSIGGSAFGGCTALESITIPDSVETIGSFVFYGCTKLTSITIPDSVTSIGEWAFSGCTALTSVTFENTNEWYVTRTEGASAGTNILSGNLSDASTAATYLKSTYCYYYWYRN